MIIDQVKEVETNAKNKIAFTTTDDSSKLFSMLSNMLYNDKHRAVLTELSSNATDAHIAAGIPDRPIKVTLPTLLEPSVSVRDYGHGLSEEHVIRFLTQYGASSKQGSNQFIGGYGIGSKSPAAVTSNWKVVSHHNGMMTQYLIFIDDNGIPSLTATVKKPTDETGLEVVIPVKPKEHYEWERAANRTFVAYEVPPEINHDIDRLDIVEAFTDFIRVGSNDARTIVLINNRLYNVDISHFDKDNQVEMQWLAGNGIIMKFKTGELSVSLSRENLQYDSKTKNEIARRAKDITEKLVGEIVDSTSTTTNEVEFTVEICKFCHSKGYLKSAVRYLTGVLVAKAFGPNSFFKQNSTFDDNIVVEVPEAEKDNVKFLRSHDHKFFKSHVDHVKVGNDVMWQFYLPASRLSQYIILEEDTSYAVPSRCKHYLRQNQGKTIIRKNFVSNMDKYFTKIKVSDMELPPKMVKTVNKQDTDKYVLHNGKIARMNADDYTSFVGDKVFVIAERFNAPSTISQHEVNAIKITSAIIGKKALVLVGKSPDERPSDTYTALEYMERCLHSGVITFNDIHVRDFVGHFRFFYDNINYVIASLEKNNIECSMFGDVMFLYSMFNKNITMFNRSVGIDDARSFFSLYEHLSGKKNIVHNEYIKLINDLHSTYPLLGYITDSYRCSDKNLNDIIEYVKLVGK